MHYFFSAINRKENSNGFQINNFLGHCFKLGQVDINLMKHTFLEQRWLMGLNVRNLTSGVPITDIILRLVTASHSSPIHDGLNLETKFSETSS